MVLDAERAADVLRERARIEARLRGLIRRTNSDTTLDQIKDIIFNEDETVPFAYLTTLRGLFGAAPPTRIDPLTRALRDAWNYFPHARFDGRSPAERVLAELPSLSVGDLRE